MRNLKFMLVYWLSCWVLLMPVVHSRATNIRLMKAGTTAESREVQPETKTRKEEEPDLNLTTVDYTLSDESRTGLYSFDQTTTDVYEYEYDDWVKVLGKAIEVYGYFSLVVPWIAVFCNTLSFLVFVSKGRRMLTVHLLLAGLAVADTVGLSSSIDYGIYRESGYSLQQKTSLGCKLVQYATNVGRDCSSYFVLFFTIDRFLFVKFPLKKGTLVTIPRVAAAMFITVVVTATWQTYMLFLVEYIPMADTCFSRRATELGLYNAIFRYGLGFLFPGAIVAVLNALIVYQLGLSSKFRASMATKKGDSLNKQNRSLTILLVTVSTFSFIVSFPKAATSLYQATASRSDITYKYWTFASLADSMGLLNHSCNFFFYCLAGSQFRKDLIELLHLGTLMKVITDRKNAHKTTGSVQTMSSAVSSSSMPSVK